MQWKIQGFMWIFRSLRMKDVARSTEGSGLGLSIAKNLTEAQKGTFEIVLDGDLFKVVLVFALFRYE